MTIAELPVPSKKEIVRSELENIFEESGRLTPDDVVDRATDEASPLHPFFEWNDTEAARLHRLAQAAGLIRSVKINVTTRTASGEVEDLKVRAWMPMRYAGDETAPEGYIPEQQVREDPQRRAQMLIQMQREVQALVRRYRHLEEFWALVDEIDSERLTGT